MSRLEQIEKSVSELEPDELAKFTEWFEVLQANRWDERFEDDVSARRLDDLADRALKDFRPDRQRTGALSPSGTPRA